MTTAVKSFIGLFYGFLFLSFLTACGGGGGGGGTILPTTTTPTAKTNLVSIEVAPNTQKIALGTTLQFTATGVYSDNSKQDLTSTVTWSSSNTNNVAISAKGLAQAVAAGTVTITAASGTVSGSTTLTVNSASLVSIGVTPTNPQAPLGTTQQFTATGLFSDNSVQDLTSQVQWSSSSTTVATISNTAGFNGLATSVAVGVTTISATYTGGITGTTTFTVTSATLVSIQVTPNNPGLPLGMTQQFTATGIYSDNSTDDLTTAVTWGSSANGVATISNTAGSKGLATSVTLGSTNITATFGGKTGSALLTIDSATLVAIDVSPSVPSIALGTFQQFVATGTYSDNTTQDLTTAVTWSSSSAGVATVSNAPGSNGLASPVATGLTTITATLGSVSDSTDLTVAPATLISIDVSPTAQSNPLGLQQQFYASGIYSDGTVQDLTSQVTWNSSIASVATVSNATATKGLATPVAPGTTFITATLAGVSGITTFSVTSATLTSIAITPATPKIALGTTLQFTAIGKYSDSSTQDLTAVVTWISSAASVAVISNAGATRGLASSVGAGSSTVTAALGSTVSNSVTLTVTTATLSSISITPGNASISLGAPQQFTATGTFSDNSVQDLTTQVTWKSTNRKIVTISNVAGSKGFATPLAVGSSNIMASFMGVNGNTPLTVTASNISSISITPATPTISVGQTIQFTATATFADGHTQDLTKTLRWSSSNKAIATVTNVPKKRKGLATGVSPGTILVTATNNVISGTTTLKVQ